MTPGIVNSYECWPVFLVCMCAWLTPNFSVMLRNLSKRQHPPPLPPGTTSLRECSAVSLLEAQTRVLSSFVCPFILIPICDIFVKQSISSPLMNSLMPWKLDFYYSHQNAPPQGIVRHTSLFKLFRVRDVSGSVPVSEAGCYDENFQNTPV
jgi:hypothetical protein